MTAVLAVDLGKTACRIALWGASGELLGTADGPGAQGLAADSDADAAHAAIEAPWQQLRDRAEQEPVVVCVGAAGALTAAAAGTAVASLADRLLAWPQIAEVANSGDVIIAHAGAFAGGPGLILVAGTGAVALGITDPPPGGVGGSGVVRVDGWGPLLGDLGSAGWIGLAGLRAAMRDGDGRGPRTALRPAAEAAFGALALLPAVLGGQANPAGLAGSFAVEVGRLAAAGDQPAQSIMDEAAGYLAESLVAATGRLGQPGLAVSMVGGLRELGQVLLDPLNRALAAAVEPIRLLPPAGGPLDGARLLAVRHDTTVERYLYRQARAGTGR